MVPNVAASLLTTARDYARFLLHVVGQASAGLASGVATREAMTTPQVLMNSALARGGRLGDPGGRVRPHALALGSAK